MLTDAEKRAMFVAVTRSATDRNRARKALQAALATLGEGDVRALLQALVGQDLLTAARAQEIGDTLLAQRRRSGGAATLDAVPDAATLPEAELPPRQLAGY